VRCLCFSVAVGWLLTLGATVVQAGPASFAEMGEKGSFIFVPERSMLTQEGGTAGVHVVYPILGQFQLTVDLKTHTALLGPVDANLSWGSGFLSADTNVDDLFHMSELTGIMKDDRTIVFSGNFDSDVVDLTLSLTPEGASLTGRTFRSHCSDCFAFSIEAAATYAYGGGAGRAEDPYLIYTALQMNSIGTQPKDWGKHFKLMCDIDLSELTGDQFNIIGTDFYASFAGVFDGNGKTISHFAYACEGGRYVGLFGVIYRSGRVEDLTLINPDLQTPDANYVGALVGQSIGLVSRCRVQGATVVGHGSVGGLAGCSVRLADCHAEGTISGAHGVGGLVGHAYDILSNCSSRVAVSGVDIVGGLVGGTSHAIDQCWSEGSVAGGALVGGLVGSGGAIVANSYSTCDVEGDQQVGGLIGCRSGRTKVVRCYSTGRVKGNWFVGGLVGNASYYPPDAVIGSFWNVETSGQAGSAGGVGLATAQMQTIDTYAGAGWDFVGESWNGVEDFWTIEERSGYPRLAWERGIRYSFGGGTGEPNDPYQIRTPSQMNAIGVNCAWWDKDFKLMQDIDLAEYRDNWFNIIGTDMNLGFTGCFDGNGKTIHNFRYHYGGISSVGLFRTVGPGGCVKNLGLIDPNVAQEGGAWIGALAGCNAGTLTGCYVHGGTVSGGMVVGGLAGTTWGMVSQCFAKTDVFGRQYVGGLAGSNSGRIVDCYCRGSAHGQNNVVGGLVADNYATIRNSYSATRVTGAVDTGGLVGYALAGHASVEGSFWDTEVTGQTVSAGGIGLATRQMQAAAAFLGAGWDFVDETANGAEDVWWIDEGKDYPRLSWERVPAESPIRQ
jgi:hypothetical protein